MPEERRPRGRGDRGGDRDGDDRGLGDVLVKLYRCATVVKGGRRFSFGALVVVGDRQGQVGYGYGKANEVPQAVEKAAKQAKRRLVAAGGGVVRSFRGTTPNSWPPTTCGTYDLPASPSHRRARTPDWMSSHKLGPRR